MASAAPLAGNMRAFLKKRWFLLLLVAGAVILGILPEWMHWTTHVDPRSVVALSLFLAASGLESHSLCETLRRPWPALWALAVSYGFLPAAAWVVGPVLAHDDFRIGLLIIASVPCTLASAVIWTRLAGGSEATALLTILLTTATSWLATTAWLAFATGAAVALDVVDMMRGLFLVLVLPVGLGQLLRSSGRFAAAADRHRTAAGVVVRLLTFLIIMKAAADVRDRLSGRAESVPAASLALTAFACLGVHLAALYAGLWSGKALRFGRPQQIAVAIAGSQKTLPVALYLFDVYFQAYPLAVVPMVVYHVGQLVADTFVAEALAGRRPKELPAGATV